ncbi:adipocyte plasma membrane-associated protein-like isoform X2 [Limulus polyphemus]|nr:adipocyte plasma membrane-associated protein-like isoform X2 [Limulus polyphemus]XP_013778715.1 adipocyte plasma membrane-associated protein-like isoform X2 [Limulus polyphemus]
MGIISLGLKFIFANVLIILYIAYGPGLLDIQPQKYTVELPKRFEGVLKQNDDLNQAEILYQGKISGPESLALYKGDIYTGTADGNIVKISKDKVSVVAKTGKNCEQHLESPICGRPLGLRFDKKGNLYVADAYYGILMVNIDSGSVETLLPMSTEVEGKTLKFPDDLDIDEEQGIIYFSDGSTKWPFNRIAYLLLEHSNCGRVISFNLQTKETKVVADGLYFSNGIQLTPDKSALLIAEWGNRRILKLPLKGLKKEKPEVFSDKFPGEPDNIRPSSSGGYWVALSTGRNASSLGKLDYLAEYPLVRKIMARFSLFASSCLNYVLQIWPSPMLKDLAFKAESFAMIFQLIPKYGLILELNSNGEIIRSMHSPDGSVPFLTEVLELSDSLYVGSFINPFLLRIKLKMNSVSS